VEGMMGRSEGLITRDARYCVLQNDAEEAKWGTGDLKQSWHVHNARVDAMIEAVKNHRRFQKRDTNG
jgi:hypothetical protein